ncbi:MAG: nucleotidyltransferase domain-containing protein [Methylococcus sp.]|nr:nucleotidyltransferase domain-containing protein [Methylococcus sp.]
MRLTSAQAQTIQNTVNRVLGVPNRVRLFGSRVDDTLSGGDIDLLIETEAVLPNRAEALCRLHGALIMAMGDRKMDILLKDARTAEAPIFEIARRTGVLL